MITATGMYINGNLTEQGRFAVNNLTETGEYAPTGPATHQLLMSGGAVCGGSFAIHSKFVFPLSGGAIGGGSMPQIGLDLVTFDLPAFTLSDQSIKFTLTGSQS